MDKRNKLTLSMGIFYMLVILLLGLIIINEKKKDLLIPHIQKKIDNYIEEKYNDQKDEFNYSKIKRYGDKYSIKVSNKKNKDLYFKIIYNKNKISDTYKKDYYNGKTLNKSIEKYLNNMLEEKKKNNKNLYNRYKIVYNTDFNNCTTYVKNNLLKKNYLLPIYTIYIETNYTNLEEILNDINTYTKKIELNPKNYHIILNNEKNISKSLDLTIDNNTMNENINEIVKLINENNFKELQKYNVKCKYLN